MTRVLITGASGFIGGHLAETLSRHQRIRCLVRRSSNVEHLESLDCELVQGDLGDAASLERAVQGVDTVYHLAARTAALSGRQLMEANAGGTARLAEICARQTSPPLLIYVSSIAAAGPTTRGQIRREHDPCQPISAYGRSKRAGELAAERWADQLPITIVRPGIVFGERNRDMLPMFQSIERFRLHAVPGISTPPLSVIHVADVVEIVMRAMQQGKRLVAPPKDNETSHRTEPSNASNVQGYYFATTREYPDYAEWGRWMRAALDCPRAVLVYLPRPLPWVVAGVTEALGQVRRRALPLNIDKMREALATSWACSPETTERELGFTPPLDILDRLRQTVDWYRQHGWLRS